MNKIIISLGLCLLIVGYIAWHVAYRTISPTTNITDNLAIAHSQNDKEPLLWLKEHSIVKDGQQALVESKEECFSLYELKTLFTPEKDLVALAQFCDSNVENGVDGYKISASCRNASARFYVDVSFKTVHQKLHEWQQTISTIHHDVIQQENITFTERGACHVSN